MEDEHQGASLVSSLPLTAAGSPRSDACACCEDCAGPGRSRDEGWLRYTRYARWLAWASLAWMAAEGAIGLIAGITAGSIALVGWALGSVVEGLASIIVIWRFTGTRTMSESAERRAQRGVAISFWLLAPYIAIEAVRDFAGDHQAAASVFGHRADSQQRGHHASARDHQATPGAAARLGCYRGRGNPEPDVCRPGGGSPRRPGRRRRLARRMAH